MIEWRARRPLAAVACGNDYGRDASNTARARAGTPIIERGGDRAERGRVAHDSLAGERIAPRADDEEWRMPSDE